MACYVTAYLDISRDSWTHYRRTYDEYFVCFKPLLKLVRETNNELIVFLDTKHVKSFPPAQNVTVVPIDLEWMNQLPMWKTLPREKEIMMSAHLQSLIPENRKACPETWCAEYTLMNHCKVEFINYVIKHKLTVKDYLSWIDFGFFKNESLIPRRLPLLTAIDESKITYQLLNPITDPMITIETLLREAPELVAGSWFMGRRNVFIRYIDIYRDELKKLQDQARPYQ